MINVEVGDGHEDDHGDEHGGGHGDEAPPDPPVLPVVDDLVPVFLRQNGVLVQVTVIARQNLLNAGSFPNIHPILAELLANLDNPAIPDADNYVVTFETAITLEQLAEEFFPLPETFAEAIEDLSRIVVFDLN